VRRFGAVGIVMIGLWSLVGAITLFASLFPLLRTGTAGRFDTAVFTVTLVSLLVSVIVGVTLIIGRNWLASRWFDDADVGISLESLDLLRVGLVMTGLFLMIEGVQTAFFSAANTAIQFRVLGSVDYGIGQPGLWATILPSVAIGLLRGFLGWLVIYYSARLAAFLWGLSPKKRVPLNVTAQVQSEATCPGCGARYDPADYREGIERRCVQCHSRLDGDDA